MTSEIVLAGDFTLEERLIALLDHVRFELRCAAALVLGELRISSPEAVDALRRVLKDEQAPLRRHAVEALGLIGPSSLVRDLKPLLKDSVSEVRSTARRVLAEGPGVNVDELASMLASRDERQKLGAIAVLGARGGVEARNLLLSQLQVCSPKLQEEITTALVTEVSSMDSQQHEDVVAELDAFLQSLEDEDFEIASAAVAKMLAEISLQYSLPLLVALIERDSSVDAKVKAIEALRRMSAAPRSEQERIFKALLGCVERRGTPAPVLRAAVDTLKGLDLPIAFETRVRGLTQAEAPTVRRWAISALGALDTAPAARALAAVVVDGTPSDRSLAIEAACGSVHGRRALGRLVSNESDASSASLERVESIVRALEPHVRDLTTGILTRLQDAVLEAPPELARILVRLLKAAGGKSGGSLLEHGVELIEANCWDEAAELFQRIAADDAPEAIFLLGVCELKLSKKTLGRGQSKDPCVATFRRLVKHREFPLADRLGAESVLEPDELYYLAFSLAEDRSEAVQGLGGDLLMDLAERFEGKPLGRRAKNKLATMGWDE